MNSILDEVNYPKKIIEIAEKMLDKLVGPAISETGELIADKIKFYRFKNQIKILNNVKKLLEENGLSPKQIPIKLVVPLLENASLEEDSSLQEMWSRLIMNSSTYNYKVSLHKACIAILSDLSPTEAKILEMIKDDVVEKLKQKEKDFFPSTVFYRTYTITSRFKLKQEESDYMVDNLVRVGLLKWEPSEIENNTFDLENFISLSNLGYNFLKECTDLKKCT